MVEQPLQHTSTIEHFKVTKVLGKGFSATTKLAVDENSGHTVALKIFDRSSPQFDASSFKLLKQEVDNTSHLDHPNVVKYLTFNENTTETKVSGGTKAVAYIAMEPILGGELFDYIANSGPFGAKFSRHFFKQMLMGLNYIHSTGFSHRDLKPENILLDDKFRVKIIDFGFTCPLEGRDGSGYNKTHVGTPGYMAPEILAKRPYQASSVDLFALGVILFIMYCGHPPFGVAKESDGYYKLLATQRADMFWKAHQNNKEPGFFTEEFMDLITAMLQLQPHNRLCMTDVIAHPWMLGEYPSDAEVEGEFARRHQINKDKAKEEEDRKRAAEARMTGQAHRGVNLNGQTYLDASDSVTETGGAAADENTTRLTLKSFDPESVNTRLCFFTTYKPNEVLSEIGAFMTAEKNTFTMSDKNWKLHYDVSRQLDDGEPELTENARVQIRFLQVPETDKICVDFRRKGGSTMLFHDNVKKLHQALNLCNNTTI